MADTHRIVIRRRRAQEQEHHGGSWKIAYADFMTAMMAFFLVMWILTLVPKEDLPGIAEFFKQPLLSKIKGDPTSTTNTNIIPGGSPSVIPNPSGSNIQTPNVRGEADKTPTRDRRDLENLKQRLETLIATNPRLVEFRPQMVLDMTPEGLRIQIVDGQNRPMFATGSARINADMETILNELAPTLNEVPNGLSVAGHTDATQYATGERYYSNWELSADRANAARKSLVAGGIAENKVRRIMGLGSTMNADPDPMAHANRRISIVVLNQHSELIMRQTYSTMSPVIPGIEVGTDSEAIAPIVQTPSLEDLSLRVSRQD
jgi:chemotaxis protein MotB